MAKRHDFIPKPDAEFDAFFNHYRQYVNAKCSPPDAPEWSHIPSPRLAGLNDAYADWHAAYLKLKEPHTSSDTLAKNLARKRDEKILRDFNNEFILYSSVVTPQEKEDLGNKPRDTHPTPVPRPASQVEADIVLPGPHLVELRIKELASLSGEPGRANYGVRIYWGVQGESTAGDRFRIASPPTSGGGLPHSTFTRRKKYRFDFSEEDRGRTVYFCLRYENSKGGKEGEGPWGPIISAIIP
jgi:hypothetical protein